MSRDLASPPDVDEAVAMQAVEYMVEVQTGDNPEAVLRQVADWCQQHPDNAQAWRHIQQTNNQFSNLSQLGGQSLIQDVILQDNTVSRRDSVKALTLLLFCGSGSWLAAEQLPWRIWKADHRTAVGEQKTLTFAGHKVTLNTDSAVNLKQSGQSAAVHLVDGEILLSAGQAPAASTELNITAEALNCSIRGYEAEFSLYQHNRQCRLSVLAGRVEIFIPSQSGSSTAVSGAPQLLTAAEAGEQLILKGSQLLNRSEVESNALAWRRGMLVVSSMRLEDFLAEVSRYRRGTLRCAAQIADLKVSGSYPLENTDRILSALENVLPVKMQYMTRYFVTAQPA
ncbi:MAG: FecR domain-containing protein [Saccharospirillaceae bacterium]|nr:FecR domain-containing protein [Saccharospirillaceae bacterium]